MNDRLREGARRTVTRFRPANLRRHLPTYTRREIDALRERVLELETEMQQSHRLNRRVAELTDVVQEVLVPTAQRDEKKVAQYLDRYSASL